MSDKPIRLIDLFRYWKDLGHQRAAIVQLGELIENRAPDLLRRNREWYETWCSAVPAKGVQWLITRRQIAQISGHNEALFDDVFMEDLNRLVMATGMTSVTQRRMLVAQTCHETASYRYMTEIGDAAYFTRMYEGRGDLGNTQPGDGYRFRGCGVIQLTGRHNFKRFDKWMRDNGMGDDRIMEGTDYVANKYPFLCAVCWIEENNWAAVCETGDIYQSTRILNGGYNGIADRMHYYKKAKEFITA